MVDFNDFREWIEQAKKIEELKLIEDADPHLEVGTMVQVNGRNEGPVHPGNKEGYRSVEVATDAKAGRDLRRALPHMAENLALQRAFHRRAANTARDQDLALADPQLGDIVVQASAELGDQVVDLLLRLEPLFDG